MSTFNPNPELVDGIDIDRLAAAVRSCSGVEDLDAGALGSATCYLPGRRVTGIRITDDRVTIQVRSRWGVPASVLGQQIRQTVSGLLGDRRLEIVVSDVDDPPMPTGSWPAGNPLTGGR
jgi:hypothetical protein